MIARISKHFIDSGLGVFDLESFIEELKHANKPLSTSHSLREQSSNSETVSSNSETASSNSATSSSNSETSSSNSQPSTVSNVAILEEEEEEDRDSISKKRKVAVKQVL